MTAPDGQTGRSLNIYMQQKFEIARYNVYCLFSRPQEVNADEFEDKEWTFVIEGVSISCLFDLQEFPKQQNEPNLITSHINMGYFILLVL